jgi:hypothetical protein
VIQATPGCKGPPEPQPAHRPRAIAVLQTSGWEIAAPEARRVFEAAAARLAEAGVALADRHADPVIAEFEGAILAHGFGQTIHWEFGMTVHFGNPNAPNLIYAHGRIRMRANGRIRNVGPPPRGPSCLGPALPQARKPNNRGLEWPLRGGTEG